jgi:hypothetical protein
MGKRIEIDGKFYRKRDGKLVEIPAEWVQQTTHDQTKKKRPSKWTAQQRRNVSRKPLKDGSHDWSNYRKRKYEEVE